MTMTTQLPDYVTDTYLRALVFKSGKGGGKEGDRCSIQEQRAWYGADPKSDEILPGDSAVVGRYIIGFQDRLISAGATPEQVYELVGRHLPKLRGSYGSAELERRRSFLLTNMLVRELAPLWLEVTPELVEHAEKLRTLPAIIDSSSNESAYRVYDAARTAAWDARRKLFDGLQAKIEAALITQAKPEGLSDRLWKRAVAAAVAAEAVAAVAAAVAAEAAAAVAAEAVAAVAEAVAVAAVAAVAAEAAEAVAAEAAVAVAAAVAAAVVKRRPDESEDDFYWRVRGELYAPIREAVFGATKNELLAKHRERIDQSWAIGGRFIEQALALTDAT